MRTSERALRNVRGRQAEVARRHARAKQKPDLRAIRIREIVRLLQHRYGGDELPPTADGEIANYVLACHLARLSGDPRKRINGHVDMRAPWMTPAERDELIARTLGNPRRWTAMQLGKKLGLADAERSALKITTIRATDGPKPKERKRQRDRARREEKRRAAGCMARADYIRQSKERFKPWEREGVSRRTWYRLLKKDRTEHAARAKGLGNGKRVARGSSPTIHDTCIGKVAQVRRQHTTSLLVATDLCHGGETWQRASDAFTFPLAAREDEGGCK